MGCVTMTVEVTEAVFPLSGGFFDGDGCE